MINIRSILYACGILSIILGAAMLIPAAADYAYHNPDWKVFLTTCFITVFIGGGLAFTNRVKESKMSIRDAFLLSVIAWMLIGLFGALPLMYSELSLSFTDAFFEAVSGITTTGSTVLSNLEHMPPGILFWRSLLQWLGGVGILAMAVSILPQLQVGGMQLFQMEFSSGRAEKIMPKAVDIVAGIVLIYIGLTFLCYLSLRMAGMNDFDAINHAMTTLATGGYSTYDKSVGYFDSTTIDTIITVFMILACLPFIQYLRMINGNFAAMLKDTQARGFAVVVVGAICLVSLTLYFSGSYDFADSFRYGAFNSISLLTGTGYSTANYNLWGGFIVSFLLTLMFIGGCAGSTTCGIKIFRFQILAAHTETQFKRLLQPHGVFISQYGDQPISEDVTTSVLSFFFLYIFSFVSLAILLSLTGLDFVTAFSGAASAISNIGPGAGDIIGPNGNFASLSDLSKWFLIVGMLLGRLELFVIYILFLPSFWRN